MGDTLTCEECGAAVESVEQLEEGQEVVEMQEESDGSIRLFESRNLFLCKNCKNPLGLFDS
ncbi:hypothetical protein AUR64_11105 [Haloprofundus marisrubri]|uniref:Uncharacterized protein n=1 Tax=Haloprofundus marisrubri TaxID=1514971 RepID=A0A0W1R9T9_9EURY|nr:hypothetical protein [Haloprofundus marisrubri]KTG10135.1 hypothetical protein AUR64_11105 [Haloprofundus marisrubri]